jgi:hypothetical protein
MAGITGHQDVTAGIDGRSQHRKIFFRKIDLWRDPYVELAHSSKSSYRPR